MAQPILEFVFKAKVLGQDKEFRLTGAQLQRYPDSLLASLVKDVGATAAGTPIAVQEHGDLFPLVVQLYRDGNLATAVASLQLPSMIPARISKKTAPPPAAAPAESDPAPSTQMPYSPPSYRPFKATTVAKPPPPPRPSPQPKPTPLTWQALRQSLDYFGLPVHQIRQQLAGPGEPHSYDLGYHKPAAYHGLATDCSISSIVDTVVAHLGTEDTQLLGYQIFGFTLHTDSNTSKMSVQVRQLSMPVTLKLIAGKRVCALQLEDFKLRTLQRWPYGMHSREESSQELPREDMLATRSLMPSLERVSRQLQELGYQTSWRSESVEYTSLEAEDDQGHYYSDREYACDEMDLLVVRWV